MPEYQALIQAMRLLADVRRDIGNTDGAFTPAWKMVADAWDYLDKQATAVLRGE